MFPSARTRRGIPLVPPGEEEKDVGRRRFWVALCNSRVIVISRVRASNFSAPSRSSLGGRPMEPGDAFHVRPVMPRENRETDLSDRTDVSRLNFRRGAFTPN